MAETVELAQDTMRTWHKTGPPLRATLQPAVLYISGNIIKKARDKDQIACMLGKGRHSRNLVPDHYACYLPTSFRVGGPFCDLHLESGRLQMDPPTTFLWAKKVQHRHLARIARARERLSPTTRTPKNPAISPNSSYEDHENVFSLSLPFNEKFEEEDRLVNPSRPSTSNDNFLTARSRPASTGRYFDYSHGLKKIRSSANVLRSRPHTAAEWSEPGFKIKKVTLHRKDVMT